MCSRKSLTYICASSVYGTSCFLFGYVALYLYFKDSTHTSISYEKLCLKNILHAIGNISSYLQKVIFQSREARYKYYIFPPYAKPLSSPKLLRDFTRKNTLKALGTEQYPSVIIVSPTVSK